MYRTIRAAVYVVMAVFMLGGALIPPAEAQEAKAKGSEAKTEAKAEAKGSIEETTVEDATAAKSSPEKKTGDEELSVDEIVDRANGVAYYQGKDGRAKVSMTITDKQGRERTREFMILRRDDLPPEGGNVSEEEYTGDQKFYVYFLRPADVSKTVFLVWKHVGGDDDRWLYLPALDLVKRIAAADKRTSFVGSEFYYEDVSGRSIEADVHELEETTDNYYVLRNTPKEPGSVEFAYYKMYIHKKSFVSVKTEYYDEKDVKYREYTAEKVQNIEGFPTVTKARMKDLRTGSQTVNEYTQVEYNIDIPEDIFEERYLRRPPVKYLR